jgi:hypothetical protein
MSDVALRQRTSVGTTSTPSIPEANRNTTPQTKTISDFFRVRLPQLFRPVPTPHPTPPPPPLLLIPAQLIVDQPATDPIRPLLSIDLHDEAIPLLPPPARLTNHQRLEQAKIMWAAMMHTSTQTITTDGHRPIFLSVENQRENAPWGDLLQEKQPQVTRVYGMNVNGLSLDKRGGQLDVLCKVIKEVQADVFFG